MTMRGLVLSAICLILMGLRFSVSGSSPNESTAWCQLNGQPKKSTPPSDARTKECCDKLDKSFHVKMGTTELRSTTGQDKDFNDIYLDEDKPSCTFTAPNGDWKIMYDKCCEDKGFAFRGDGKWYHG